MKISDILLNELTFQGSKCTKDCSGHLAGYNYALTHDNRPLVSPSGSFLNGAGIADLQRDAGKIVRPKVRDERGRFSKNPQKRIPKRPRSI